MFQSSVKSRTPAFAGYACWPHMIAPKIKIPTITTTTTPQPLDFLWISPVFWYTSAIFLLPIRMLLDTRIALTQAPAARELTID